MNRLVTRSRLPTLLRSSGASRFSTDARTSGPPHGQWGNKVAGVVGVVALGLGLGMYSQQQQPAQTTEFWEEKAKRAKKREHACTHNNKFSPGCRELQVFAGNANRALAEEVAKGLGKNLSDCQVGRFADGEVSVKILNNVRGSDTYVVQPTCPPTNEHLMELLLLISALKHASAKRVTAIIPYYGYLRSSGMTPSTTSSFRGRFEEKIDMNRTSNLAASDVATMLEVSGADRVVTVDLQPIGQGNAEGFFDKACVDNIQTTADFFVEAVASQLGLDKLDPEQGLVVLSPHTACLAKAQIFQSKFAAMFPDMKIGVSTIIRTPTAGSKTNTVDLVGDVKGKNVVIVEDIVDTGSTTIRAIDKAKEMGAEKVFAFSSHALLNNDAETRLQESQLEKMVVLDGVPVPEHKRAAFPKLSVVSIAPVLSELVQELHFQEK